MSILLAKSSILGEESILTITGPDSSLALEVPGDSGQQDKHDTHQDPFRRSYSDELCARICRSLR